MKIVKILNNNAVVSKDQFGSEIIVMGKGIGYAKKIGSSINNVLIEKIFELENMKSLSKIESLFNEIDLVFFKIVEKIINYANQKILLNKNDLFFFILADHISSVIARVKDGFVIKNTLTWEIKQFYPKEYEIGLFSLKVIKDYTNIQLSNDEAAFIAFHFINNNIDSQLSIVDKILKIIQEIMNIIKYTFNVVFDESSFYYHRFLMHLKFFATRLLLKQAIEKVEMKEMQELIFEKHPQIKKCIERIASFIETQYQYQVQPNEKLYLSIHLTTILKIMKGEI